MIERLKYVSIPEKYSNERYFQICDKINEIIDYINDEDRADKRLKVLYGIENINTGEITFNAIGCAYTDKDDAYREMKRLGEKDHRLVKYRLEEI